VQQGRLFLGAGQRDAQVVSLVPQAAVPSCGVLQMGLHLRVVEHVAFHPVEAQRLLALGQDLQDAGTIPAHGGQQVEGLVGLGTETGRQALADRAAVGKEVVEVVLDGWALDRPVVHPEGQ
jgi:hypothetical protein